MLVSQILLDASKLKKKQKGGSFLKNKQKGIGSFLKNKQKGGSFIADPKIDKYANPKFKYKWQPVKNII
jgi:hypothetical protein